jgi:Zn-dependent protease with chaperone function
MRIEIDTYEATQLYLDLMEGTFSENGQAKEVPGGATIAGSMSIQESVGATETITLVVSFVVPTVASVGINLFSNWLYDKLSKRKVKTLRIERRVVRVELEEIKSTVYEITRTVRRTYATEEIIRIEE